MYFYLNWVIKNKILIKKEIETTFTYSEVVSVLTKYKSKLDEEKQNNVCIWKIGDFGSFGIPCMEYQTSCGKNYDADEIHKTPYCPNCGKPVK